MDDGPLLRSSCIVLVDHLRMFLVDKLLEAASHKRNAERQDGGKLQSLKTVMNCKTVAQVEKVSFCQEWIKVCITANIPLYKSDDNPLMREFLQSSVVNGGAIPKCSPLHDYCLFDVYQTERANLKEIIKNKNVALVEDKLSDDEGHYVLDIIAVLLDFDELSPNGNSVAYLLETHFLNTTNNRTVSKTVVKTVH